MFDDPPVCTVATIHEALAPNLYQASLPNGKKVIAHLSKALLAAATTFEAGTRVNLELTPYDFDTARIVGEASASENGEPEAQP